MSLAPVVELYRACGKPRLEGADFGGKVAFDQCIKIIDQIRRERAARFVELVIDGEEIEQEDDLPQEGEKVDFRLRLSRDSSNTFHDDISDLIRSDPKISKGEMPVDFYLVSEDFYSAQDKLSAVDRLESICTLIKALSRLAHYHDARVGDCLKLVFMRPEEGGAYSSVELETRIDRSVIEGAEGLDTGLVERLCEIEAQDDPHYTARIGVFNATLAEFVTKRPVGMSGFSYLVSHWKDFSVSYQKNLETYISGFAFHKAKREVAEAELEIAERFSKVVGDIAGKLFGIPISLAATVAILKSQSLIERTTILIGICVASLLLAGAVANQRRQFDRIKHAKGVALDSISGREDSYPDELRKAVKDMIEGLDNSENKLRLWFRFVMVLSWIPFVVGLLFYVFSVRENIALFLALLKDLVEGLFLWLSCLFSN